MMWYAHTLFHFFLSEGWEFRAWVSGQSTCWWMRLCRLSAHMLVPGCVYVLV